MLSWLVNEEPLANANVAIFKKGNDLTHPILESILDDQLVSVDHIKKIEEKDLIIDFSKFMMYNENILRSLKMSSIRNSSENMVELMSSSFSFFSKLEKRINPLELVIE